MSSIPSISHTPSTGTLSNPASTASLTKVDAEVSEVSKGPFATLKETFGHFRDRASSTLTLRFSSNPEKIAKAKVTQARTELSSLKSTLKKKEASFAKLNAEYTAESKVDSSQRVLNKGTRVSDLKDEVSYLEKQVKEAQTKLTNAEKELSETYPSQETTKATSRVAKDALPIYDDFSPPTDHVKEQTAPAKTVEPTSTPTSSTPPAIKKRPQPKINPNSEVKLASDKVEHRKKEVSKLENELSEHTRKLQRLQNEKDPLFEKIPSNQESFINPLKQKINETTKELSKAKDHLNIDENQLEAAKEAAKEAAIHNLARTMAKDPKGLTLRKSQLYQNQAAAQGVSFTKVMKRAKQLKEAETAPSSVSASPKRPLSPLEMYQKALESGN